MCGTSAVTPDDVRPHDRGRPQRERHRDRSLWRTPEQQRDLFNVFRMHDPSFEKENTAIANIANPAAFESHWPGNGGGVAAYGPGGAAARPRSATVMITKNDGGVVGL